MNEIEIGSVERFGWLWLVGLLAALIVIAGLAYRRRNRRFATPNRLDELLPKDLWRRSVSAILLMASMSLLVVALSDIRWGKVWRDVPQKGIEVVFLLDVSRSMLAEDATPNRLERAKQQIKDTLEEMPGDRVALVLFAGEVRQHVPMTSHFDDFRQSLELVGPHNISRGGSRLGDAITVARNSFLTKTNDHKAIILFTDGEDQASEPIKAAKLAQEEMGIRIFAVGLGDFDSGARIPVESANRQAQYLQHEGREVWSKLDGKILKQVAEQSKGAYIPAGTKQVNMSDVYRQYVANIEQTEFDTAKIEQYEARFQWFLGPAILILLIEIAVSTPRARVEEN